MLVSALLTLSGVALADVPATPIPPCEGLAEGDACTTADDEDGTCDAEGTCVVDAEETGCATLAPPVAGGVTVLALSLLAVGRRRS